MKKRITIVKIVLLLSLLVTILIIMSNSIREDNTFSFKDTKEETVTQIDGIKEELEEMEAELDESEERLFKTSLFLMSAVTLVCSILVVFPIVTNILENSDILGSLSNILDKIKSKPKKNKGINLKKE